VFTCGVCYVWCHARPRSRSEEKSLLSDRGPANGLARDNPRHIYVRGAQLSAGRPKNTFGTTETQSTSRTLQSFRV